MLTNVVPSPRAVTSHSTCDGRPYAAHSIRIRRFDSTAFTTGVIDIPYISHVQTTSCPGSRRALPFVNQNLPVIAGLTNASKTSATGRRINIPVFATGG